MNDDLPLAGVRVLDLTRVLAGPECTMVLADMGADVIKVEHPVRGDDTREWGIPIGWKDTTYYYAFNRNKRSVALDLSTAEGQEAIRTLASEADALVENFIAGGMEKFGLGYEDLKRLNPKLVYCAISGYDRQGQEASRPGYDMVIQGEAGLMAINGEADRPPLKFGVAVVDMFTGMYAAQGVLGALYKAQKTGRGTRIDVALYDCGVNISAYYGLDALMLGRDPERYGNGHPSVVPYGVFEAADGSLIVAVGNDAQFKALCSTVLDRADLASDGRFTSNFKRVQNRDALIELLNVEISKRRCADLLDKMAACGIPYGRVLGLHEALNRRRTQDAGLLQKVTHPTAGEVNVMAPPWRFDGKRPPVRRPPTLGEHTEEVLAKINSVESEK
jgi:crotonobetainyl-CoA:carnitine CoA-transferase CaiB-like acyl-CoA transferase